MNVTLKYILVCFLLSCISSANLIPRKFDVKLSAMQTYHVTKRAPRVGAALAPEVTGRTHGTELALTTRMASPVVHCKIKQSINS